MSEFALEQLQAAGFTGFRRVGALRAGRCASLPDAPGVYIVLRASDEQPVFLDHSRGGWFKGQDPTVPVADLALKWVPATRVVYIGMAGTSLRQRVRALVDYGGGKPVGHHGGRYLWQVDGGDDLLVAWRLGAARAEERRLLDEFRREFGSLPFANLVR